MSIYTKSGDTGNTSIIGGKRVPKDDIRIASYGAIDELSSEIGLLITYCPMEHDIQFLHQVQRELFLIGGYLASDLDIKSSSQILSDMHVQRIEKEIDTINRMLPPIKTFILPGGCRSASLAHVCRTICRRAERNIVAVLRAQELLENNIVLAYINRLSDYFFVLARKLNLDEGVNDCL